MLWRSRSCTEKAQWYCLWKPSGSRTGVKTVDISLKDQLVKVDATSASYEDVEAAIKKTGKVIKSGRIVDAATPVVNEPAVNEPAVVA